MGEEGCGRTWPASLFSHPASRNCRPRSTRSTLKLPRIKQRIYCCCIRGGFCVVRVFRGLQLQFTPWFMSSKPPLWRCPKCGRKFANRNQSHACGRHTLAHHFTGKPREIRALYDRIVKLIRAIGPVRVLPEKTRIAFQVRMSFAQITPRQRWLDGHVVLARRYEHPRFRRVETFSPRNHLHAFRVMSHDDLDAEFVSWLREAYAVGEQRHLQHRGRDGV